MDSVRQSVAWLKDRVPIDDIYTPHLIFILNDYAKKYHKKELEKLKENGKDKLE